MKSDKEYSDDYYTYRRERKKDAHPSDIDIDDFSNEHDNPDVSMTSDDVDYGFCEEEDHRLIKKRISKRRAFNRILIKKKRPIF